jgi:ATP-dependent exoDNAse (exonuclease V) beta subunit
LLTERFLALLGEVDDPGEIVAITFTNAAAAEMRNRVLDELRKEEPSALARRALERSNVRGWRLLDLPAQLRISTIDAFCRELALQQPLLSGLGGGLEIAGQPKELYRRAARRMFDRMGEADDAALNTALEALLEWRDNNWFEIEGLLVEMLSQRDRWMQDFVLSREPDWAALREQLERPFRRALREGLTEISRHLDQVHGASEEALWLARFACGQPNGELHRELAELAEFPAGPFDADEELEEVRQAFICLGNLLLKQDGAFRRTVDKRNGFPPHFKSEKDRLLLLNGNLGAIPGLEAALAGVRKLPPAHYPEAEWEIIRACFTLLRHAAAQLQVVFAEAGVVDFIQVAQIAQAVLNPVEGFPSEAAQDVADRIRHLLVDEFQDTSRRQHRLLSRLVGAWADRAGRTCFAVGDPMQSIYSFREAETELFARVKEIGLEVEEAAALEMDSVQLAANFRTTPELVDKLNDAFRPIFAEDDGIGIGFSASIAAREAMPITGNKLMLHINFYPKASRNEGERQENPEEDDAEIEEADRVLELIRGHLHAIEEAKARGDKYRIAVLARKRKSLTPIAEALRCSGVPFRAVELESLAERPEILDALALGAAVLNPEDRVAWLGVLRAPWCGLTLEELHVLTSGDEAEVLARTVPELIAERLSLLSSAGRVAAERVLEVLSSVGGGERTESTGTWLQQAWQRLGGADCYDETARANLELLWALLDRLPSGKEDLLGPALDAALKDLTALADPMASSDCGVQLMTIHKAKGLEFEVVIVPELEAKVGNNRSKMLSWLERGLRPERGDEFLAEDEAEQITEFLVAPLPSKGEDAGLCKGWVDRAIGAREEQEKRRILYVAATRAREELHLFASIACKADASGELTLLEPQGLLATAWPAFEAEIRARFEEWKAERRDAGATEEAERESRIGAEIESIAASVQGDLFVVPASDVQVGKPTLIRRLPEDYRAAFAGPPTSESQPMPTHVQETAASRLYARHEGSMLSRLHGVAVHSFFEQLARLRAEGELQGARDALRQFEPRVAAQLRGAGVSPPHATRMASDALQLALDASEDPTAQWILAPHRDAVSEACWTGVVAGSLATVRVDRVFRAGHGARDEGDEAWWIVDYKTAHEDGLDASAALARLRPLFAPQIEAYAQVLRNLHGADAVIRAGLYYPRMRAIDWWEL